jgi:hypothetical protein
VKFIYKSVIVLIFILPISFCKDVPTSPIDRGDTLLELTQTLETSNFIFHYSAGDFVYAARSEAFHNWAVSLLGVTCPKKIDYYKYKDREQQKRITGSTYTGWAILQTFEAHSYLPWMNHECVHLYTALIGRPSDFFNEGIAVALQTDPYNNDYEAREKSGERVHDLVRRYEDGGVLIPIDSILDSSGFRNGDFTIAYPEAGSFIGYLIDTYGIDQLKNFFASSSYSDSIAEIKTKFQIAYGISINVVEQDWLNFL